MRRTTRGLLVSLASTLVLAVGGSSAAGAAPPVAYPRPGTTQLVSAGINGQPASKSPNPTQQCMLPGGGHSWFWVGTMDVSANGRYAVFTSPATNLVPDDTNGVCDVFRFDRQTRKTIRVSVGADGSQGLDGSQRARISADGRFVTFLSYAPNLVPGDTNLQEDVFVRDLETMTTARITSCPGHLRCPSSANAENPHSAPAISADGRYVTFSSYASTLVPDDTNGRSDIFVYDRKTKKTVRASVNGRGEQGNRDSSNPSISADGNYVAFGSQATNLVPGDTTSELCKCPAFEIFVRDLRRGTTVRVSIASDGSQADFSAFPTCVLPDGTLLCYSLPTVWSGSAISADGRYVVFTSTATNLVPNDTNFRVTPITLGFDGADTFVHDLRTHRTDRVSVNSNGHERDENSTQASISASGGHVAYTVGSSCGGVLANLPPLPLPLLGVCGNHDASVYDRGAGSLDALAVAAPGAKARSGDCTGSPPEPQARVARNNYRDTYAGGLSGDGRYVGLYSAQDLTPNDTNELCDYFLRDRGSALGAGAVLDSGSGAGASPDPNQLCLAGPVCLPPVAAGSSVVTGVANLVRARVTTRPALGDLYVRWDVARLAAVSGAPAAGVLYELAFTSGGQRYQIRAQRLPGPDYDVAGGASFGLFRQTTAGLWTKVAALKGGYGTISDSVVTAVPLSLLGGKPQLTDVTAYTAVGSYLSGPTKVLDSLRLSR